MMKEYDEKKPKTGKILKDPTKACKRRSNRRKLRAKYNNEDQLKPERMKKIKRRNK